MERMVVFSALNLVLVSVSLLMGYYTLQLAPGQLLNKIFALLCTCLAAGTLTLSIILTAPNELVMVVWSRLMMVSYTMVYAVLLHFAALLTGGGSLRGKYRLFLLFYIPALLFVLIFACPGGLSHSAFQFAYTGIGWTRISPVGVVDIAFLIYGMAALLLSLGLLLFWQHRSPAKTVRIQARLLIVSLSAALALGTFLDITTGTMRQIAIPPLVPFLSLIPLAATLYCMRKYHFMKQPRVARMELILTEKGRTVMLRAAAYGFFPLGIVLVLAGWFWWSAASAILTIFTGVLLIGMGAFIFAVKQAGKGHLYLEGALILTALVLIPVLMVNTLPIGGVAMWMVPVALVVCALIFNSRNMLVASACPGVVSQIYLTATVPRLSVTIDYRVHMIQTGVLVLTVAAAYAIHRVYVERLRENAMQSRSQLLISEVATQFSLAGKGDPQNIINSLMLKLSDYFDAHMVLAHAVEGEFSDLIGLQYHCPDGQEMPPEKMQLVMERWTACLCAPAGSLGLYACDNLPGCGKGETAQEECWIFIPVYEGDRPAAFFYIESKPSGPRWTQEQLVPLPIISRIVSDALETRFMAYYDNLTKLPNRRLFYDRADQAIHLARRNGWTVAIAFLNLDSFKSINDTMGHEGGDQLIRAVAHKLVGCLRRSDTVARFGGDEFMILLNNVANAEDISKVADKVLSIFEEPVMLNGQEMFVTASCGVAVYPVDGEDAKTLIKHADIAMYTAKEKGKNCYAFCSNNMKQTVQHRAALSNSLYRALERGQLQVYYQPQVDVKTQKIAGFEALLRWFHPEYGMVPPAEFIGLAEQTGLINSIGSWVLETACAQMAEWTRQGCGKLRMAVNLSVVQIRNPSLTAQVARILEKTGIDPEQLELEITESATIKEPDYIIHILDDLKLLGVSISIDDFGTEYSSLNRLKTLPIDRLKMDMQFVHGIDKSEKDRAIALVILNLARNLDLKLVAEGVETISQLDFLRERMCDEVQGYYYYKPMPVDEIGKLIRSKDGAQT